MKRAKVSSLKYEESWSSYEGRIGSCVSKWNGSSAGRAPELLSHPWIPENPAQVSSRGKRKKYQMSSDTDSEEEERKAAPPCNKNVNKEGRDTLSFPIDILLPSACHSAAGGEGE